MSLQQQCKRKVLVVEDDDSIRFLLRDLLQLHRHDVYLASDGENALKYLQSENFDLLMTDLGLPGISGWELAAASRRYQSGIRVMAITSWQGKEETERIAQSGIDLFVWKPFRFEEILAAVEKLFPVPGAGV
jgi:DNA-binding response OmpR family regulator